MLPNISVINEAAKRNNISLQGLAKSVFEDKEDIFLDFVDNRSNKMELEFNYNKLSQIAEKLHIPFGYLFLNKLPNESLKIPQLRRKNIDSNVSNILKESAKNSEHKQLWYREYLISIGEEAKFAKKYENENEIIEVIKKLTNFDKLPQNPSEALKMIIDNLEMENCLIFVASNINRQTSKSIKVEDCRGYCLYDKYAPVIFLNNKDSNRAKIFTLLHELAHILYGENAITAQYNQHLKLEKFCNNIAGEIIIPKKDILRLWDKNKSIRDNAEIIEKEYLASKEAIATKARNLKLISQKEYKKYIEYLRNMPTKKPYGRNETFKKIIKENSRNFTEAIITQTLNNKLDFKSAMEYLGIKNQKILMM